MQLSLVQGGAFCSRLARELSRGHLIKETAQIGQLYILASELPRSISSTHKLTSRDETRGPRAESILMCATTKRPACACAFFLLGYSQRDIYIYIIWRERERESGENERASARAFCAWLPPFCAFARSLVIISYTALRCSYDAPFTGAQAIFLLPVGSCANFDKRFLFFVFGCMRFELLRMIGWTNAWRDAWCIFRDVINMKCG